MPSTNGTGISVVFLLVIPIALSTAEASTSSGTNPKLLFEDTFDSGRINPKWSKHLVAGKPYSSNCVTHPSPVRAGKYSHRTTYRKGEGRDRSELCLGWQWSKTYKQPTGYITGGDGDERWYGLSVFIPADWKASGGGKEIILQWLHIWGYMSPTCDLRFRGTNLTINVISDEGMSGYKGPYKGGPVPDHNNKKYPRINEKKEQVASIPLEDLKGKWTDWVFHGKWSSREDGLLEVWRDGKMIVNRRGPNCRRTKIKHEFKLGVYHIAPGVDERVIYHDEIRIGGPEATYDDVAPGGKFGRLRVTGIIGDVDITHCLNEARSLLGGGQILQAVKLLDRYSKKDDEKGREARALADSALSWVGDETKRLVAQATSMPATTLLEVTALASRVRGMPEYAQLEDLRKQLSSDKAIKDLSKLLSDRNKVRQWILAKGSSSSTAMMLARISKKLTTLAASKDVPGAVATEARDCLE